MKLKGDIADPLDEEQGAIARDETDPIPGGDQDEADSQAKEDGEPLREFFGEGYTDSAEEIKTEDFPRIETHTETQSLKCILTHDEIKLAGERMARADGEKRDHEATMKSVVSRYKAKIDEVVAVMSSEGEKIRSGYEFRPVDILVEMDHSTGRVTKTRKDTSEVIEDRRMSEFEAQRKIKF